VRAAFASTRYMFGDYELDFRILKNREIRWISARGRGEDEGIVGRIMFGVFLDVGGTITFDSPPGWLDCDPSRPNGPSGSLRWVGRGGD
jgi:hypothetical protein